MENSTDTTARQGLLIVVSGPSGSGKTTLCRNLRAAYNLHYTTSCTTRAMRPGETHSVDYYFLEDSTFREKIANGEFLEHAEVHGRRYGTLKSEVLPHLRAGHDVIMDLDTQGAAQLRTLPDAEIRASLVDVFILPKDQASFRERLTSRSTESPEQIAIRLRNAEEEMQHWREYTYALHSGTREEDLASLTSILLAERQKAHRLA